MKGVWNSLLVTLCVSVFAVSFLSLIHFCCHKATNSKDLYDEQNLSLPDIYDKDVENLKYGQTDNLSARKLVGEDR